MVILSLLLSSSSSLVAAAAGGTTTSYAALIMTMTTTTTTILMAMTSPFVDAKKLVIYAGPHQSASTSIEDFFYQYASGHSRYGNDGQLLNSAERKKTFGLRYWKWPKVTGRVANETEIEQPYKIFGHLVTDHTNDLLRLEILQGIRTAWETPDLEGIILGSEEFDQVGSFTSYDALNAIRNIVKFITVPPNDVTLVLNYRTPRLDHWASIWAHATKQKEEQEQKSANEEEEEQNNAMTYEEWLCDVNRMTSHIEALATQMNPLNAVDAFVKEGWNVRLIDMEGVTKAGRDISHVIACDIVTGRCKNGAVMNHETDRFHHNSVNVEFSALSEEQRVEAEALFRSRDCAYIDDLHHNIMFGLIYNHSVWSDCDATKSTLYKKLKDDPTVMYKALLSQITCPNEMPIPKNELITMSEALYGKSVKPVSSTKDSQSQKKHTRSTGGILLEFFTFIGIMMAAMAYQYHRMTQTAPYLYRVESAIAQQEEDEIENMNEEDQFTNNNNINHRHNINVSAEYGDAESDDDDNDDDDAIPKRSGYRD